MKQTQNPTDGRLILQYKGGNTTALPILVQRYHKLFCEKAYWVVKDREAAKDIAQDCWITIINKLDTLKNENSFKGWALKIVYSKAIDAVNERKKKSKMALQIGSVDAINEESKHGIEQKHKTLLSAILQLPQDKQSIIRLFYAEEYSVAEISKFLDIPLGTVKSRLFKAREKLKSIINTKQVNDEK